MAMVEDMTAFFSTDEFAVLASFAPTGGGAVQEANVIFDKPTEDLLGGDVLSDEYAITYAATALPSIKAGDSGQIGGVSYKVRDIRVLDDGALKRARLSKV